MTIKEKKTDFVAFHEEKAVIAQIDKIASDQGLNRSGVIRQILREKLRSSAGESLHH